MNIKPSSQQVMSQFTPASKIGQASKQAQQQAKISESGPGVSEKLQAQDQSKISQVESAQFDPTQQKSTFPEKQATMTDSLQEEQGKMTESLQKEPQKVLTQSMQKASQAVLTESLTKEK